MGFSRNDDGARAMKFQSNTCWLKLNGERGVALIIVLWIFIFLSVVAFEFSAATREEAAAALRFDDETQGYYLAVAGFERGLYDFLNQQGSPDFDSKGAAKKRSLRRSLARARAR